MDKQHAALVIQFMQRVQLSGHEAPAFMTAMAALTAIATGNGPSAMASPLEVARAANGDVVPKAAG